MLIAFLEFMSGCGFMSGKVLIFSKMKEKNSSSDSAIRKEIYKMQNIVRLKILSRKRFRRKLQDDFFAGLATDYSFN